MINLLLFLGSSEPCQVPIIPNGECSCWTTKSSSCTQVYHLGRVACTCDSGYQSLGQEVLTCNNGKWDRYTPSCICKWCFSLRWPIAIGLYPLSCEVCHVLSVNNFTFKLLENYNVNCFYFWFQASLG